MLRVLLAFAGAADPLFDMLENLVRYDPGVVQPASWCCAASLFRKVSGTLFTSSRTEEDELLLRVWQA